MIEMCRAMMVAVLLSLVGLSVSSAGASYPVVVEGCFDIGGTQLFYLDVGEGEPVVVLHGFAMTFGKPLIADRLARALGPQYRLIAPHLRGHGRSDTPHDPDSYGLAMVEDIICLINELDIEKAHIIGHSFGGLIALKLATIYPERVTSLVIAGIGWLSPDQRLDVTELIAMALENEASLRPLLRMIATSPEQLSSFQSHIAGADSRALAACIRSTSELVISEAQLRSNLTPTLAVIGDRDPFRISVERMREAKPNLTVVVVAGSGHSAAAAPDSLQIIGSFLSTGSTQSGISNHLPATNRKK